MDEVQLKLNEKGHGAFYIMGETGLLGEMIISVNKDNLTVFHTEVAPAAEGKGLAKKMLQTMVDYARKNNLKVIPICPYVHGQFRRHPQDFEDVWNKTGEEQ
jgi:predicted GNAT family acetyltransferase